VSEEAARDPRESLTFEQIVAQLSEVVDRLEGGEIPLEQALLTFEQGIALSRLGSKRLDEAERRIEILMRDEQGLSLRPMAVDPSSGGRAERGDDE
jgi:exodeoxyribonuclease VII small subunit